MLYQTGLYGTLFYGAGPDGEVPGFGPIDLNAYQNNPQTVVLYWSMTPFDPAGASNWDWELQTSLTEDFSNPINYKSGEHMIVFSGDLKPDNIISVVLDGSPIPNVPYNVSNVQTLNDVAAAIIAADAGATITGYRIDGDHLIVFSLLDPKVVPGINSVTVTGGVDSTRPTAEVVLSDYIQGILYNGMVVEPYERAQGASKRMYWRVRARIGVNQVSGWASGYYDIPEAINEVVRGIQLSFLPDVLYDKSSSSNIYKIHDAYAIELDELNKQAQLVNADGSIFLARDTAVGPNYGVLCGITRPEATETTPAMQVIDYRSILRAFMTNLRKSPTQLAASNMIYALYRTWPNYYSVVSEQEEHIVLRADVANTPYYVYAGVPPAGSLDAHILDRQNRDFGVIIEIENNLTPEGKQVLTDPWAQDIIKRMIQAHVPVYFRYV